MDITQKLENLSKLIENCDDLLQSLSLEGPIAPSYWMTDEEISEIDFSFLPPKPVHPQPPVLEDTPLIAQHPEYLDTQSSFDDPVPRELTPLEIKVFSQQPPGSITLGITQSNQDSSPVLEDERQRLIKMVLKAVPHVTPSLRSVVQAIPVGGATVDKLVGLTGYSTNTVRKALNIARKTGHISFRRNYLAGPKYNSWYFIDL